MNKIIRDYFPVSRLPQELRRDAAPATHVRLTMEQLPIEGERPNPNKASGKRSAAKSRIEELGIDLESIKPVSLADIRSIARPVGTTPRQAVQRIRRLRAERDD